MQARQEQRLAAGRKNSQSMSRRRLDPHNFQLSSFLAAVSLLLFVLNFTHGFSILLPLGGRPSPLMTSAASAGTTDLSTPRSPIVRIANSGSSTEIDAKKTRRSEDGGVRSDDDDGATNGNIITRVFKKSPGVAIVAPVVLIFGLDLIVNIAVITKRSLEVLFTGEYTVWTPWQ